MMAPMHEGSALVSVEHEVPDEPAAPAVPKGTPVNSPMNGIYYSAPSPNAPPFVREGESVTAGQVIGLIEAMKVFNEINAPVSGTVTHFAAENGQLVSPGDALLFIS
jgi:acetyl-CoA carboxylase biotin carboxyl carrier protein